MRQGRPSSFTQSTADKICADIVDGKSLRKICSKSGMPNITTVMRWLGDEDREDFRKQYARAREEQTETYVDQIIAIADEEDDPQKARVRIDARKWVASKLKPKKYGDKVMTEHSGPDGGDIPHSVTVEFVSASKK